MMVKTVTIPHPTTAPRPYDSHPVTKPYRRKHPYMRGMPGIKGRSVPTSPIDITVSVIIIQNIFMIGYKVYISLMKNVVV
jgi:hypothetical protein